MNASLNEKLGTVKWGEFKLGDLFEVVSYKKCFDANKVAIIENRGHPYILNSRRNYPIQSSVSRAREA